MLRRARPLLALLAAAVSLAALAAPAGAAQRAASRSAMAALDLGILEQLNQIRAAHGLDPLVLSPSLSAAAMQHTRDMVAQGYFAHASADGQPFWKRIASFYPSGRYAYWSVGENLYWTTGFATPEGGTKAWMASPEHRHNILDPNWRQIGIAAVTSDAAPGAFDDLGVTVITTDFGVRR
jgi:uncharacterized protein YkwD